MQDLMSMRSNGMMGWLRVVTAAAALGLVSSTPAPVAAQEVPAGTTPPRPTDGPQDRNNGPGVNINTASVAELMFLPRIGQKKAEAIVARREKKKFSRPEELMDIKGIGRGIYKRLRPFVRTQGTTTATAKLQERA